MPSVDIPLRSIPLTLVEEGAQVMRICNACRYCEGFCAVFPAMERRLAFSEQDLNYLANLCHDCGECFYSCQYAPPHPFNVNVPALFSQIRRETYRKYAWPGVFAGLFNRNRLALVLSAVLVPLLFVLALWATAGPFTMFSPHADAEGAFYQVMPHVPMTALFSLAGVLVVVALIAGPAGFWRDMGETPAAFFNVRALRRAASDTFTLRYLDGGGEGCAYPSEVPSETRRRFHHLTFYGFLLCFAATTVAAIYHNFLGWKAPYAFASVPVLLGSVGGVGLLIGPIGLLWLKTRRDPQLNDRGQIGMDRVFLALLFLTSLTGFLLLVLRESAAMGVLLGVHLGVVLGLFLTMPYGKFVHGLYRFCALVRNALEEQRR
jgi:citrate/tricarballylate utilization protein